MPSLRLDVLAVFCHEIHPKSLVRWVLLLTPAIGVGTDSERLSDNPGSHSKEGVRQSDCEVLPPHTSLLPQTDCIKHRLRGRKHGSRFFTRPSHFPISKGAPLSLNPGALFSPGSPVQLAAHALLSDVDRTVNAHPTHLPSLYGSATMPGSVPGTKDMVVNGQGKIPVFTEPPF